MIYHTEISCGVSQLYKLGCVNSCLREVAQDSDGDCAFVLFSDGRPFKNGERLVREIKKHRLGKVVASDWVKNPNSRNQIRVWTWQVNWPNLRRWEKKYCD